jgi:hypothetical protein
MHLQGAFDIFISKLRNNFKAFAQLILETGKRFA